MESRFQKHARWKEGIGDDNGAAFLAEVICDARQKLGPEPLAEYLGALLVDLRRNEINVDMLTMLESALADAAVAVAAAMREFTNDPKRDRFILRELFRLQHAVRQNPYSNDMPDVAAIVAARIERQTLAMSAGGAAVESERPRSV